jgi:opacity protein-like surface antigen
MASLRINALAGALMLATSAALAADMPYEPAPPPLPPVVEYGGWYLRGDIGFSNQEVDSLDSVLFDGLDVDIVQKDFDSAPFAGVGVGYRFNKWFRADVTGEYRGGASFHGLDVVSDAGDPVYTNEYSGIKKEVTGLVNVYVDLGTWHGITPFLGAGIGASYNTISSFKDVNTVTGGVAYADDDSQWDLAWALQAGLAYEVTPGLSLEVGYRYLHLGDAQSGDLNTYDGSCPPAGCRNSPIKFEDLSSHDVKFAMRWMLGGATAVAEEEAAPVFTK